MAGIKNFNRFWDIVKDTAKRPEPTIKPVKRPAPVIDKRPEPGGAYIALPLAGEPLPKRVQLTQPVRVLVRRSVELSTMQQYKVVGSVGADRLLLSVGRDVVEVSRAAVKVLR